MSSVLKKRNSRLNFAWLKKPKIKQRKHDRLVNFNKRWPLLRLKCLIYLQEKQIKQLNLLRTKYTQLKTAELPHTLVTSSVAKLMEEVLTDLKMGMCTMESLKTTC